MWLFRAEPVLDLLVTSRLLRLMMFTEKTRLTEKSRLEWPDVLKHQLERKWMCF